jgi:hypothetical protein
MIVFAPTASADPGDAITPTPVPDASVPAQTASNDEPAIDHGTPHLTSVMNLPPETTSIPDQRGPALTYLRELWRAYQTQEISGSDALFLFTQRPMNRSAAPPAGMPVTPRSPNSSTHLPPAAPAPQPLDLTPPAAPAPEPSLDSPPPAAPAP